MKLPNLLALGIALLVSACASALTVARSEPASSEVHAVRYRLVAVPHEETSPAKQGTDPLPFRLLASGSAQARIVDLSNKVVRSAPAGGTIFDVSMSPNRQRVLLYFGDAEYAVASVEGFKDIARPPTQPIAPTDATGFSWHFLDDDRLIGSAALPSLESTEGMTASEVDGLPPRGTLVYTFIIATGAMIPVEIDDSVPKPFSISMDSYGNPVIFPLFGLNYLGMKIVPIPSQ